ncbi:MAG: hypothetical protein AAF726_02755 [Planctomycetota bacterium]
MAGSQAAFAKGSVGCVLAFFFIGTLAVALGGHATIDLGGFVLLVLIRGVFGLVVNAIYQKGRKDARDGD